MPTKAQARTVFISYAREDEQFILPVAHLLRAAGAVVFLDQEDIPYGEQWESVLLEKLRASERVLVFWSMNAAKSEWVRREYLIAIGTGLRVIPIPLDKTPLSAELATFQALTSLVPLVYQARRGVAPRRMGRLEWLSRPSGLQISMALMALIFTIMILPMMQASLPIYSMQASPAAEESPESALLSGAGIWVLGVLGVLVLILLVKSLGLELASASVQHGGKDLQTAIYDAIFGETSRGESA